MAHPAIKDKAAPSNPWRAELSKIDIWYAAYGSHMLQSIFLCNIKSGKVEGMKMARSGSMDRTPPKEIVWKSYPYRLFFGRESTRTWGPGGVAFLEPESKGQDKAHLCLFRITLEQFNDVLAQENCHNVTYPLFDKAALASFRRKESKSRYILDRGWYRNVIYLGTKENFPVLTMTCSSDQMKTFKSGKGRAPPCEAYKRTLRKGLVNGGQLSNEKAAAYIQEACSKL